MCRILVAEDNEITAKLICSLVRQISNVECKIAYNSEEEIECLAQDDYDLVIQDIQMMSKYDGWEIAEMIKENPNLYGSPLLLFLTSLTGDEVRIKSFQTGGYDYISKPWDEKHLFVKIESMVELAKSLKKYKSNFKLKYKSILLNTDKFEMKVGRKKFELTDMEYKLMALLVKAKGEVVPYKDCIKTIYGLKGIYKTELEKLYALKSHLHKKTGIVQTRKGEGYHL